ncbi:MAG: hypothetical protein ACRCYZ_03800 [Alphaproteobacteria bacterium]
MIVSEEVYYVKATVQVREYLDKTLGIFYGHRCLARFTTIGEVIRHDYQLAA